MYGFPLDILAGLLGRNYIPTRYVWFSIGSAKLGCLASNPIGITKNRIGFVWILKRNAWIPIGSASLPGKDSHKDCMDSDKKCMDFHWIC